MGLLPTEKIHLGLDLQGGVHLVLEVQTDKAVENRIERMTEDLRAAIKKAKGIVEEKKRDTSVDVRSIKKKIRELRTQKEAMREAGEKDQVRVLRRRISRLKKRTRRAAKAAA